MALCLAAAVGGLALGGVHGLTGSEPEAPAPDALSPEVLARVGEVSLLEAEVEGLLRQQGVDPATATVDQRDQALDRLIEEELWVREGHRLDLLGTHRPLRDAVVRRMLDNIFPESERLSDEDLRPIYEELYGEEVEPPPFDKVRFRLEERFRRQRNESALRSYVEWLQRETDVEKPADSSDFQRILERAAEGGS